MTDKEKEAIQRLKRIDIKFFLSSMYEQSNYIVDEANKVNDAIETVLNLIQTQQAEIEQLREKRENQKKELAILNEKQKEFNNLVNTVKSYKGQFKRQQAEIEKYKTLYAQSTAERVLTSIKDSEKSKEDLEMLYKGCQMELEQKIKMINEMAKEIYIETDNYGNPAEVIKCFERKIENGN